MKDTNVIPKATSGINKVLLLNKNNKILSTRLLYNRSDYVLCIENYDKKKDQYMVRYFANEAEFEYYAAQQPDNSIYRKALNRFIKIKALRDCAIRNGDIYKDNPQQYSDETKQLLEELGGLSTTNTAARGVGILYDKTYFRGSTYPLLGVNPNYGRFRNKAESVRTYGISTIALCDKRWFRGRKLYLFYYGYSNFPDLGDFNFRNEAESNFEVF